MKVKSIWNHHLVVCFFSCLPPLPAHRKLAHFVKWQVGSVGVGEKANGTKVEHTCLSNGKEMENHGYDWLLPQPEIKWLVSQVEIQVHDHQVTCNWWCEMSAFQSGRRVKWVKRRAGILTVCMELPQPVPCPCTLVRPRRYQWKRSGSLRNWRHPGSILQASQWTQRSG